MSCFSIANTPPCSAVRLGSELGSSAWSNPRRRVCEFPREKVGISQFLPRTFFVGETDCGGDKRKRDHGDPDLILTGEFRELREGDEKPLFKGLMYVFALFNFLVFVGENLANLAKQESNSERNSAHASSSSCPLSLNPSASSFTRLCGGDEGKCESREKGLNSSHLSSSNE